MSNITKIVIFCLIGFGTILSHSLIEQYETSGPEMLTNEWTVHASDSGYARIDKGQLILRSDNQTKSQSIGMTINTFEESSIVRLSADMTCTDVVPGEKSWNKARLILGQYNNDNESVRWNIPHVVAALDSTTDWQRFSQTFEIVPGTRALKVTAQLSQCTGTFQLKDLSLTPVRQTMIYTWTRWIALGAWSLFGIWITGLLMVRRNPGGIIQILLVISFITIIIGTSMPQEVRNQMSREVSTQIQETIHFFDKNDKSLDGAIPKIGHFIFFALLGMVIATMLPRTCMREGLLYLLLTAGGTELAQTFIDGRSALFFDFFIDLVGGFSGIGSVLIYKRLTACRPAGLAL